MADDLISKIAKVLQIGPDSVSLKIGAAALTLHANGKISIEGKFVEIDGQALHLYAHESAELSAGKLVRVEGGESLGLGATEVQLGGSRKTTVVGLTLEFWGGGRVVSWH